MTLHSIQAETLSATLDWLLSDPANILTGQFAEDDYGNTIDPRSPDACYFCTLGFMLNYTGGDIPVDEPDRQEIIRLNDAEDIPALIDYLEELLHHA